MNRQDSRMTLLVSWTAVDPHGPTSVYIASDSRFTWPNGHSFDHGRKVIGFANHPDILGYCGDVVFPSIVLGQIVEMGDCGLLFRVGASCEEKFRLIGEKLKQSFLKYPSDVKHLMADSFLVVHISRDDAEKNLFTCHEIEWRRRGGWSEKRIPMPSRSDFLCAHGSGATEFTKAYKHYAADATSRAVFHCFCATLSSIRDPFCGGAPQLVGLYSKHGSNSVKFGIIMNGERYLFGANVDDLYDFNQIQWRNELLEICDGQTMARRPGAQAQPDSRRRK
jgi:hypothetical protein